MCDTNKCFLWYKLRIRYIDYISPMRIFCYTISKFDPETLAERVGIKY